MTNHSTSAGPEFTADLEFTGERFIPGLPGEIWLEHWHRYHFAASVVAGKRVLDVACGEGYGSHVLAQQAASVDGVDISAAAVAHARGSYGAQTNLKFHEASCVKLPFHDASFDIVVSFETIEHIHEQREFLAEVERVLKPDGYLLVSSPNKAQYSDAMGFANEYHVKELYVDELQALLAKHFPAQRWYGQRHTTQSMISSETAIAEALAAQACSTPTIQMSAPIQVIASDGQSHANHVGAMTAAMYFLVFAARQPQHLPQAVMLSQHIDSGDWLKRDYAKVLRDLEVTVTRVNELQSERDRFAQQNQLLEASIKMVRETQSKLDERLKTEANQLAALAESAKAMRDQRAAVDLQQADLLAHASSLAQQRASFSWWLRLPLYRLQCWLAGKRPE
jgi:2-polyprenyl-3-methyl-5-hydroxy-6-metoxy-1,4-benzoquinol methylase